ncbi:hypothetical protein ACJ41O_010551 [Fusarium nematophilum]
MLGNPDIVALETMSVSASWLEATQFEETIGGRPVMKGTAEEMRAQFARLGQSLAPLYPPPADTVSVVQGSFEGTEYRIYTPKSAPQEALPIGVYFHAGGFVVGSLDSDDMFCRVIAEISNVIIVNVGYRLAPDHKAPAQVEDALKMVEWVYHNAASFGADPAKIFTIGTSAGGALALGTARKVSLGQSNIPKDAVRGVVAFCPVVFHPSDRPETKQPVPQSDTPIVDQEALLQYFEMCEVQPDNADYFIGLDTESHSRLPSSYIVTCGFDPLRDDGQILADSMESRGLQVKRDHYELLPHCFWIAPTLPESAKFMTNTFQGISWVLDKM